MDCLFRETERGLGSCDPYSIRVTMNQYLGVGTGAPSGTVVGDQEIAQVPGETPGTVQTGRQRHAVQLMPNPWGTDFTTTADDTPSGAHKVCRGPWTRAKFWTELDAGRSRFTGGAEPTALHEAQ
jgi:hypothetical protein